MIECWICNIPGYLVMAFNKNNATQPIGTFKLPSDGQLIDCNGGVKVSQIFIENNVETFKAIVADQTVMLFWFFFFISFIYLFFFKLRTLLRTHLIAKSDWRQSTGSLLKTSWAQLFSGNNKLTVYVCPHLQKKSHEVWKMSLSSLEIDCFI